MKMIYFNNAADSFPKLASVNEFLSNQDYFITGRECSCQTDKSHIVTEVYRNSLKEFLNIPDSYQVTITQGATEAANLVIQSFAKQKANDDYVVYDHANHNSVIRPIFELYGEDHVKMHRNWFHSPDMFDAGLTLDLVVDNFDKCNFIVFNYQSNVTGSILQNPKEIIKFVNQFNMKNTAVIFDITQAIGNADIDIKDLVSETNFDRLYLFGTMHKSMCSISGAGFLIHPVNNKLKPLMFGGTGTVSLNHKQPTDYPHYLESGTYNITALACATRSIDYFKSFKNQCSEIKKDLTTYFIDTFKKHESSLSRQLVTLQNKWINESSGIINLIPKDDTIGELIATKLFQNKCIVRFGCHCCPMFAFKIDGIEHHQTIRISFNIVNTKEDINKFLEILFNILFEIHQNVSK